jgi:hypothetical protein
MMTACCRVLTKRFTSGQPEVFEVMELLEPVMDPLNKAMQQE